MQFFNTGLIIVFVNWIIYREELREIIWSEKGLVTDVWFILLGNLFVGPAANFFNPDWLLKLLKRHLIKKQGKNCKLTQKEANEAFEGDEFDMAERYSVQVRTMMISIFFMPMIPASSLMGVFAVFLTYWVDKYLIVKRQSIPSATSPTIAFNMFHFFDLTLMIYAVRNFYLIFRQHLLGLTIFIGLKFQGSR